MSEILIFRNLHDEVARRRQDGILFGKRSYVTMRDLECDLFFHYTEMPVARLTEEPLLVVPVLSYRYPEQSDEAKLAISDLNKKHPNLRTFALRTRQAKLHESEGETEEKAEPSLEFFDARRTDLGTEIKKRAEYFVASQEDFKNQFENWEELYQHLLTLRQQINTRYQAACL